MSNLVQGCMPNQDISDKVLFKPFNNDYLANKVIIEDVVTCNSSRISDNIFFCFNNGKCSATYIPLNDTHLKKYYYCECDKVLEL